MARTWRINIFKATSNENANCTHHRGQPERFPGVPGIPPPRACLAFRSSCFQATRLWKDKFAHLTFMPDVAKVHKLYMIASAQHFAPLNICKLSQLYSYSKCAIETYILVDFVRQLTDSSLTKGYYLTTHFSIKVEKLRMGHIATSNFGGKADRVREFPNERPEWKRRRNALRRQSCWKRSLSESRPARGRSGGRIKRLNVYPYRRRSRKTGRVFFFFFQ